MWKYIFVVLVAAFKLRKAHSCGGVITSPRGIITSPHFPNSYDNNANCVWDIKAPLQFKVRLNFTHFSTEQIHDTVIVESLSEGTNHPHGIYTGSELPPPLISEDNHLRITFRSDGSTQSTGFRAIFDTVNTRKIPICLEIKNEFAGSIKDIAYSGYHHKCWKIKVPTNNFIRLKIQDLNLDELNCAEGFLKTKIANSDEYYMFCNVTSNRTVTSLFDIRVDFQLEIPSRDQRYVGKTFTLDYEIKDLACIRNDSFYCSTHECISNTKVCDGVEDCGNGSDEKKCDQGIAAIDGVSTALSIGIHGLSSKYSDVWEWMDNSPRAVTALYLAGGATFDGQIKDEELMVKQTEIKIAIDLLKESISSAQTSMLIHALLVTCHDPRNFYGQDLVQRLERQVQSSTAFIHPIAYLALCNSNVLWSSNAYTTIEKILTSKNNSPIIRDFQAYAVLALSCDRRRIDHVSDHNLTAPYRNVIRLFKESQASDGSFGNNRTTSLIIQALLSSGEELSKDWNLNSAINYLIKELNDSQFDIVSTYLVLPVLNRKSLADIAKVNCSGNPGKHRKNTFRPDLEDFTSTNIQIQYVLYVGDDKNVIHTISLKVPENSTAFEVMQKAEYEDPKYTFHWKTILDKIYVYGIGKYTNDPDAGIYWLLYVQPPNGTDEIQPSTLSPDKLVLNDDEALIMWYKTADF